MDQLITILLFLMAVGIIGVSISIYATFRATIDNSKVIRFLYERKVTLDEIRVLPSVEEHAWTILSFKDPKFLYSEYVQDCWDVIMKR